MVKPERVSNISMMMLISGILNALFGCVITLIAAFSVIGLCIIPLTILPAVLGGFEIYYASKLTRNPPEPVPYNYMQILAGAEIASVLWGNIISAAMGVVAFLWLNEPDIREWFENEGATSAQMAGMFDE